MNELTKERIAEKVLKAIGDEKLTNKEAAEIQDEKEKGNVLKYMWLFQHTQIN